VQYEDSVAPVVSRVWELCTDLCITVVPVIIVGRHLSRLGAPKAHALSPRSLEICRQFDISVAEIRQHPAPRHEARWVRFVTNLSGQEVGCLPYERMSLDVLDASPEVSETDVLDVLARHGAMLGVQLSVAL
jgi:hypothetical protein